MRAISISTLYLVSTTVDRMSDVSAAPPPGWPRPSPPLSLGPPARGQRPGAPSALLGAQGRAPRGCPPTGRCCPQVLWPYLLEFLVPVRFTRALTPLCRSLVHLAQKRQEQDAGAFLIQYNGNGAPRPRPRHRSHPDPDAGPGTAPTPALARPCSHRRRTRTPGVCGVP